MSVFSDYKVGAITDDEYKSLSRSSIRTHAETRSLSISGRGGFLPSIGITKVILKWTGIVPRIAEL